MGCNDLREPRHDRPEVIAVVEANSRQHVDEWVLPGIKRWNRVLRTRLFGIVSQLPNCDTVFEYLASKRDELPDGVFICPKFKTRRDTFGEAGFEDTGAWNRVQRAVWKWVHYWQPPWYGFDWENACKEHLYDGDTSAGMIDDDPDTKAVDGVLAHPDIEEDDVAGPMIDPTAGPTYPTLEDLADALRSVPRFLANMPTDVPVLSYPGPMSGVEATALRQMMFTNALRQAVPHLMYAAGDFQNPRAHLMGDHWIRIREWAEVFRMEPVPKVYCCIEPERTAKPNNPTPRYWLPREIRGVLRACARAGHRYAIVYAGKDRFEYAPHWIADNDPRVW